MAITVPRDPEAWAKLGKTIREHREEAGYSRRALAEKAGVSEKSIQVAEEGRVPRGRMPQSLSRIGDALGWLPGAYISILRNQAWGRLNPPVEVEVELESVAAAEQRAKDSASSPSPIGMMSSRDVELTQSGHLAQDVFMRQAKRFRKLRGVSTEQLGEKLAGAEPVLTQDDIRRLEDGTRLLRMAEATAIASALETTVDWLLGSGFSSDAPEEMRWPPNAEELEAEANAVLRRMGDVGTQVNMAVAQRDHALERAEEARRQAEMATTMLESATAQQREMERHYQYLLGRIDSIRAAKGEDPVVQFVPVYEDDGEPAEAKQQVRPVHTRSGDKAGMRYYGSKAERQAAIEAAARKFT
ncbi:helix-turn-helix domain-containing protein [Streptomyces sp. NBC_01017]|uniref:helix-turn-helix domain-containing protein n=1 Tax=Streptomyces sp. NBC_01017 TaxID=2903721 RepID=UPI00386503A1|nr:helix-turn-helix domain-containing protein [Streptomyces sp. NBC_01017]